MGKNMTIYKIFSEKAPLFTGEMNRSNGLLRSVNSGIISTE